MTTSTILDRYNRDKTRLMDILIEVQSGQGHISTADMHEIAKAIGVSIVDVEQTVSFYHFFSQKPTGKVAIYLNDSAVAEMKGRKAVARAFEEAARCKFGEVTSDGAIGLHNTACIGMNDQEPAALIGDMVFTNLTPDKAKNIVKDIESGMSLPDLGNKYFGRAEKPVDRLRGMVKSNVMRKGPILETGAQTGTALKKAVEMGPEGLIKEITDSGIRGRGGAGFPTGIKWKFCRGYQSEKRYVFCNADEGEPGTFKDRVILTEMPGVLFEGMALAGFAIGSDEGVLYLRHEYKYMKKYLEEVLEGMRRDGLMGKNIAGKSGFNFDIRIQFGGGAYVCGEESALIESAEGKRGEPRDRPPFPVEKGYLDMPTVVNNVETLCAAVRVMEKGSSWFRSLGTKDSAGTKVLSISGDCEKPGIYEVEWGFSIRDLLEMVGAREVQAVQVGGPSGVCIGPDKFDRILCFSDLATGGSIIIMGKNRDLLKEVVLNFTEFFLEESCGSCVPCRAMTGQFRNRVEKILAGKGTMKDLEDMKSWGPIMKLNRCGLGQTAANPILTTMQNLPAVFESRVAKDTDYISSFDLAAAVEESCKAAGRKPNLEGSHHE